MKSISKVEATLKALLESNNVANIFFSNKEEMFNSSTKNVEVTILATYKQFTSNNIKMLNHYLELIPHPCNFDKLAAFNIA